MGMQAIKSHTGALAENSDLIRGLINQSHIHTAASFQELFQYALTKSLIQQSQVQLPTKGNIALITVSGGAGSVSTDIIEERGLHLPILNDSTYAELAKIYPDWMPPNRFSLLDIWPAIEKSRGDTNGVHRKVIEIVIKDPNIEGLLLTVFYVREFPFEIQMLYDLHKKYKKPIFTWIFGDYYQIQPIIQQLRSNNIPTFENLEEMIKNFQILCCS
jgi:acetyltransferase